MRAPTLTVNLTALRANYRLLAGRFSGGQCGGVVKANAYGLGVAHVAPALWAEGCRAFFVATLDEGTQLRTLLPDAAIYIFHGPYPGEEQDFSAHALIPVLNSLPQWERWRTQDAPFALHIDTGMHRLGLTLAELESLQLATCNVQLLLSHLACANDLTHKLNARQLAAFRAARALLPDVPASLCNSSGIFLGRDYHFDLARPGCALYGINPRGGVNPMQPVVTLSAPILQIREAEQDGTVGYGGTFDLKKGERIAIVQLGYADGYRRSLSNKGTAYIGGHAARIAGRVSMDMIALDLRGIPEAAYATAPHAEIINDRQTVDDFARATSTIGYEVLTGMGARVRRVYTGV